MVHIPITQRLEQKLIRDPINSILRLFLALTGQIVQLISDRYSEMRQINLLISERDPLAKAAFVKSRY